MSDRRNKSTEALSTRHEFARDRRIAPRYAASGTAAVISWPDGSGYRSVSARMIDISLGGFSAWVETFPPRCTAVWLRLDNKDPSAWLKASVIETITSGYLFWTRRRVRGRFLEACPYDLFKGAIEGFSHEISYVQPHFEETHSRCWCRVETVGGAEK
jgi:hypothetical protein